MSQQIDELTPRLVRDWPLPDPRGSKYDRGSVLVLGGSAKTPGAAQLSGLRVGRLGFLAREILDQLPAVMVELDS
jgi:NAD(P)H-hydrate repair Nnr-like enzyme with NAD(P)H-hydrate dehydratase domain